MSKTPPKIIRAALLVLALAGISAWAWRSFGPESGNRAAAPAEPPAQDAPAHEVLVTYFTTDQRCETCLKIEKLTRETVEGAFSDELASGEVRFHTANFDRPEHKHFIDEYELSFKTVVVSDRHDGEETAWAKFDDVWILVDEPDEFAAYLEKGVRDYLKSKPDA